MKPALVVGTKLLPYEERLFRSGADMAVKLGYTEDLAHYYSEAQVEDLVAALRTALPYLEGSRSIEANNIARDIRTLLAAEAG